MTAILKNSHMIFQFVNKNNIKSCHNLEDSIINATKMYVTNNKYELGFSCSGSKDVSIQTLLDSGDLKLSKNRRDLLWH